MGSELDAKTVEDMLDRKLGPLMAKLTDALEAMTFMNAKYEDLSTKVKGLEKSNEKLCEDNRILQLQVDSLMKRTNDLDKAYDQLEQYGRRECLEIKGIPETKGENTDSIVVNLASKMGVQINESDISVSHRNPNPKADQSPNSTGPAIIVKFTRRNTRDQLFKSRLKLKNITTKDLGYTRTRDSRIFISESLTPPRKDLYLECVRFKKSEGYKYLWTRYGKIFLREDDESPAILIKDSLQLEDLK